MSHFKAKRSIYFIRAKDTSVISSVKIGCSIMSRNRLIAHNSTSPVPLEIIGQIPGSFSDERKIHNHLVDYHSHSEWFIWSDEVSSCVKALVNGDVVPDDLKSNGALRKSGVAKANEHRKITLDLKRTSVKVGRLPKFERVLSATGGKVRRNVTMISGYYDDCRDFLQDPVENGVVASLLPENPFDCAWWPYVNRHIEELSRAPA